MKKESNNILIAFIVLIVIVSVVALAGFVLLKKNPEMIQGEIEVKDYRVSSKIPGRIHKFYVEEGQKVQAGDTLAIIDSPELHAKQEQAQAAQRAAESQNMKAKKGAREEKIQMAYEMYQKAKAASNVMEKSYTRIKNLYDEEVVAAQKLDEITAKRDAAKATEKAAKAQYDMALKGAEREDKLAAQALVDRANGAVNEVNSYLKETILIAPIDGEVAEIFPENNELIGQGAPIMTLNMMNKQWVSFNVREDLLSHLRVGQKIKAFVPALDNKEIELTITFMKDLGSYATWKATKTTGHYDLKTFEVKATPTQPIKDIRAGMSVIYKAK